jgi:hypothetical protein
VHRPGDLTPQVFLGTHQESGHGRGHGLVAGAVGPTDCLIAGGAQDVKIVGDGVAIARECPPFAVEHLDLGLHQGSALGERDEPGRLLETILDVVGGRQRGKLFSRRRAARLMTRCLGLRLRDQQVDLAQFLVERQQVVREPAGERVEPRGWLGRGVVRHQSSGIRIQPWRIA